MPVLVKTIIVSHWQRPGSHEAHFAFQDVDELRQFIYAGCSQKIADWGDSRVIFDLEYGAANLVKRLQLCLSFLSVRNHGPEFIEPKSSFIETNALLDEKKRARRCQFDQACS